MDPSEFLAVLELHPFLKEGLLDHRDEVLRIAERIVVMETATPVVIPDLPDHAPEWERAYWERRRVGASVDPLRVIGRCDCGQPIVRGTGNTATKCGLCAKKDLRYEDGLQ